MSSCSSRYELKFAILAVLLMVLISGCIVFPLPATKKDAVAFGRMGVEDEVQSFVSNSEDWLEVKDLLGEPIIDFGPRRVFVYQGSIKKGGSLFWLLGAQGGAIGGIEPLVVSHLLFIAFDSDGKVLKAGAMEFKPFDSIGEQVRDWLATNDLATQVFGSRPEETTSRGPALFLFRPSKSPCPFPTYDSNTFKPSVTVDGIVVGDLLKGEYLASGLSAGAHVITIDPVPFYRYVGMEDSTFVQMVLAGRIPITVNISVEPDQPAYIETYLCTGTGKIEMHAEIRDAPSALQAMRGLKPAW